MTDTEESGVTFEIPDFEEKKTPIFEQISDIDIDDLEPLSLEVEKTPETPAIKEKRKIIEIKKPAPKIVPEVKVEESTAIDYSKVSEFGEYPAEPKPVLNKKPEKAPTVSEKPYKSPAKKGLWARLVDKIPVDKDGRLALKPSKPSVDVTSPQKKQTVKIEVIDTSKTEEFIPIDAGKSAESATESLIDMDDLFEDTPAVEVPVPVKVIEPIPVKVPAPVQSVAPKRSMMKIIEEPISQPDPEPEAAVSPEIQKLIEKIKAPVPTKPIVEEKPKTLPTDREIKKLFRDVLTKRKVPVEPEVEEEAPVKRSYVERKFSPVVAPPIEQTPPVSGVDFDDSETVLPDPVVDAIRRKPLPPVKMVRKETFWGRLKKTKIATMVIHKQKERKRNKETGLTARQRIKRYNAIHEGGYGMTEGVNDKDAQTQ